MHGKSLVRGSLPGAVLAEGMGQAAMAVGGVMRVVWVVEVVLAAEELPARKIQLT